MSQTNYWACLNIFLTITMLPHNLSHFYHKIGLQMQNTMGPNIFLQKLELFIE